MSATTVGSTVIVIGGALKVDNDAVWQRVVDEAGGSGARIVVFATAASTPQRTAAVIVAALNRRGARAEVIPVAPNWKGVDLAATLRDPARLEQVRTAQGVFFSGGAQDLIVDTLQPAGRPTAMLDAIRSVLSRGGMVAGTSAGAAVMGRMMFRDALDNHLILKGRWREGREYDHGLGFVGPDLFVDQHFLTRGRIGRILPAMSALGYGLGLGVEENSAVVVKGRDLEVIGARGALLVDLGEARSDPRLPGFNLQGARLSYLDHGDRHRLDTAETTPAGRKLQEPLPQRDAAAEPPGAAGEPYYLDILGDQTLLAAMIQLLTGPRTEVRGLAYRAMPRPDDPAPDLGFEFRLYQGPGTRGWCSSAVDGEEYTLLNVRLDVMPVRMAQPLFTPVVP